MSTARRQQHEMDYMIRHVGQDRHCKGSCQWQHWLALSLLLWLNAAAAAELGAPEIRSYLGEPLQARIELDNADQETMAAAKTSLAPPLEWARQGAGAYPEALQLSVAIEQDEAGYFVAVRSEQPVNEPVLQLVVDLQLPERELISKPYILFLDPKPSPGDLARRSLAIRRSERIAAESGGTADAGAASTVAASMRQAMPQPSAVNSADSDGSYGPVQSGETLWSIAQRYAASTPMTAQQWLVAFQNANPQALQDPDNVNTLRSGVMLSIPDSLTVAGITHYDAVVRLREQNMAWSNSGGRLQLLGNNAGAGERSAVNDSVAALRIARLQEELLTVKRENAALREQVDLLNTEIDLRDQEISSLKAASPADANDPAAESSRLDMDYSLNAGANPSANSTTVGSDGQSAPRSDDDRQTDRIDPMNTNTMQAKPQSTTQSTTQAAAKAALAAQMPETGGTWFQQIEWLPDSLSGLVLFAALLVLMLAALYWALRSMFTRSSDDSEYQNMLNELNRHRQQPDETEISEAETSEPDPPVSASSADEATVGAAALAGGDEHRLEAALQGQSAADELPASTLAADTDSTQSERDSAAAAAAEQFTAEQPQSLPGAALSEHAEHGSDDTEAARDDDDWREQINAIMDEVNVDNTDAEAHGNAQPQSTQDGHAGEHAPTAAGPVFGQDADQDADQDVSQDNDQTGSDHAGDAQSDSAWSQRGHSDDNAPEEITPNEPAAPDNLAAEPFPQDRLDSAAVATASAIADQQSDDSDVDLTSEEAADGMAGATEDAAEQDQAADELLTPLKFELASESAAAEPDGSADSEDQSDDNSYDDWRSTSSAEVAITAPLAFDTASLGAAADRDVEAESGSDDDLASTDSEAESADSSAASGDELLPPLSFDAFAADLDAEDDAEQTDQPVPATTTATASVESMESNFDPFAESIPEPQANLDDDWLQQQEDSGAAVDSALTSDSTPSQIDSSDPTVLSGADAGDDDDAVAATARLPVDSASAEDSVSEDSGSEDSGSEDSGSEDSGFDDDEVFDGIEIKLDLARAYLAMGDHQAMRILLDEIGDQGSPAQREEMASLLQQAQAQA